MKLLVLLLVLASLLAACGSAPRSRQYPPYDGVWWECEKVKTGRAAGSDYQCAR